ncbi:MAG: HAMP domain-containing sensor histidine kinase [Bacteroidetes bacterium]|nr:HAMP domain-containing sensor histidine kinase [Bacteroidota bacterium]MDA1242870.1 HAMP domain-containing sensor histidine kinase [Bacteroidota bacterium]
MMVVVVCALLATGFVAYRHSVDAERAYNAQRLLRKEAALQRSLSYMIDRMGGTVTQDSLSVVFTDRICELADVHSLTFSLYNQLGRLVTTSAGPGVPDSTVALTLPEWVVESARNGVGRTVIPAVKGGTEVVWPLEDDQGLLLALGHVHYDPRVVDAADWRAFLSRLAPVYLMLLLLVGLLALSLTQSVVGPLRKLKSDMQSNPLDRRELEPLSFKAQDEIGALVVAYNELLFRLRKSMEERGKLEREGAWRDMAQQVAHEIKNPLTPLRLGAQHLLRAHKDGAPDFDSRVERFVATTITQVDTLTDIVEGFAMLANDGLATPEVVDARDGLRAVAGLFGFEHVQLVLPDESLWIEVDRNRFIRAVTNLVKNAVEADSTSVVIRASHSEAGVVIEVEDNGTGMSEERIETIFEPKFTTKTHGLGLGLAMVRAFAKGARGSVMVRSQPSLGSCFVVVLPNAT